MKLTVWKAPLVAALGLIAAAPMASGQEVGPVSTTQAGVDLNLQTPTVERGPVVVLGPSTARLTGTVDTNNLDTSVFFEYGSGDVLNLRTPTVSLSAGADPTQVFADLVNLQPGSGYRYRLVAENAAGRSTSEPGSVPGDRSGSGQPDQGQDGAGPPVTVSTRTGRVSSSGQGAKCTIVGTAGNDVLKGTSKADVICGLAGNDRLSGRGGNDVLVGGDGKDRISGGGGRDLLYGNGGRDRLAGNAGRDRVYGNLGNDRLVLSGDKRRGDRANGGKGRDRASVNRGDRVRSVERVTHR